MTALDDLRAQMHALNAQLADAANKADALAVALQNYRPDPAQPTPPTPTASPVEYALYCYNDPAIDGRWTTQTLQGQPTTIARLPGLRAAGVKRLYRYTNPCTRTVNDKGIRQAYGTWKDAWLALDKSGQPIMSSKFRSNAGKDPNYLIDVGLVEYQQESARYLVSKCRTEGWTGVYLDEINEYVAYAGYKLPANCPSEAAFRALQLDYVKNVAKQLKTAGYETHVNLAANPGPWRDSVVSVVDGVMVEFFSVQHTINDPGMWHVATVDNGEFGREIDYLTANEKAGKTTVCQADARSEAEVLYALCMVLLANQGHTLFAATKGGYGLGAGWWTSAMDTARQLGQPKAPLVIQPSGLWQRDYDHGRVTINPTGKAINTMPATTGLIELK